HLMIVEPEKYVEAFAKAGASNITVHVEASPARERGEGHDRHQEHHEQELRVGEAAPHALSLAHSRPTWEVFPGPAKDPGSPISKDGAASPVRTAAPGSGRRRRRVDHGAAAAAFWAGWALLGFPVSEALQAAFESCASPFDRPAKSTLWGLS